MPRRAQTRNPIQARAVASREKLLDATAELLERGGYDALTTNAVAEQAGTSVGTVYQYFRSRESLLQGVLVRYAERLQDVLTVALHRAKGDVLVASDGMVNAFARVWMREKGYRAAWSATQALALLDKSGAQWSAMFEQWIAEELRKRVKGLSRARARVVASTAVHLVSGILLTAVSREAHLRASLIAQARVALRAYLQISLGG